jgi:tripartite-type tricarboxylate transporter receptor subunit TctC
VFAPAKTDTAIIQKLNAAVVQAIKDPEVIEALQTKGGNDLVGNSPAEFEAIINRELKMYDALIQKAKIKQE